MIIQETADGSHTLYLPEMDEHYHSVNGAVQESRHVYIDAGLRQCPQRQIHLLEMGFGTGLNALLTALEAPQRTIHYTTLEKFPIDPSVVTQLNYGELAPELFAALHQAEWDREVPLTDYFTLHKVQTDFSDFVYPPNSYDLVYYDAFAPDKQEGVWSQDLFDRIACAMKAGGILTTYCAKGYVRRMMQAAGLTVERIPGPPGKREILRARKERNKESSF